MARTSFPDNNSTDTMGQVPGKEAKEGMPGTVGLVQSKLTKHAGELKQIATLTYEKFLASLKELNEM